MMKAADIQKRTLALQALAALTLILMLAACGARAGAAPAGQTIVAEDSIASVVEQYRQRIPGRMEQENVPGLAIAIVDDKGILWAEGFGSTDRNGRTPITPDTLFSIQSMSKSFTATAAMFAAQDGLVDLDAPITDYLPDFRVNSIFEDHPEQKMTLRLLLSHTAGLVHEAPVGGNNDLPGPTFEEHIASISDTWLKFPVGTRYSYSNLGIDLAGYILQVRSGMPFTEYVREKVLAPLGMAGSTLEVDEVRAVRDRAIGHVAEPIRPPAEFLIIPSGGVWTTARDMARYLQFHINFGSFDGTRLLRQDLAETMYNPPNPAALGANYALGIGTTAWGGTRRFQHGGGGFGFVSDMIWYPELKLGGVLLTNAVNDDLRRVLDEVLVSIISSDVALYHSRASTTPSVEPAYGYIRNGPPLLCDACLSALIDSKALPANESSEQRRQSFLGKYVFTTWGFPDLALEVEESNGGLVATAEGIRRKLTEVEPGLLVDEEGGAYDLLVASPAPNYALYKANSQLFPAEIGLYGLGGLVFLSAILAWPARSLSGFVRRRRSAAGSLPAEQIGRRRLWWNWLVAGLTGFASLFTLVCLVAVLLIPNLVYVPWPRPYSDLAWWQFTLLSLPFVSLALGACTLLLVGLVMRKGAWKRPKRIYLTLVALLLVAVNLAILL